MQTVWHHPAMTNPPEYMTIRDVAALIGVSADTVSAYKHRGQMPPPDAVFGQSPVWLPATIETWHAGRVGRGRKRVEPEPIKPVKPKKPKR